MKMKGKLASLVTVITLLTSSFTPQVNAKVQLDKSELLLPQQSQTQQAQIPVLPNQSKVQQNKLLKDLSNQGLLKKANIGKDFQVHWDKNKGIPRFIQGITTDFPVQSKKDALNFVDQNKPLFNLTSSEFTITDVISDDSQQQHFKLKQTVDGIDVYGKELLVHTDINGQVYAMNGDVSPSIDNQSWVDKVSLSEDSALTIAKKILGLDDSAKYLASPTTHLYLYEHEKNWYVAYLVNLQFISPYLADYKLFIDAETGDLITHYNALKDVASVGSGTGVFGDTKSLDLDLVNGKYYLVNKSHPTTMKTYTMNNNVNSPRPGDLIYDTDNTFNHSNQAIAVDAHANIEIAYEYYLNKHGRNSYDNNGAEIISSVNYYDRTYAKNNAFWVGTQMLYGDGDGSRFGPFSAALDVVAHEFTHAVTQETCDLEYKFQSGAINESMSDVFGAIIENKANGEWWLIGEDCYTPNTSGDALRNMKNPEEQGYPAHMDDYLNLPLSDDNGGVHKNSSIPNKAFYLIASDIGFEASGKIYYKALSQYLTAQSNFMDLRNALLQSADDIYGNGSSEYTSVLNGFNDVGIGTSSSSDTYEPNDTSGQAYGPLTSGQAYSSYISSSSDQDYYHFTSSNSGTLSISLTNLAGDYDIFLYNASGSQVAKSEKGGTSNESISYQGSAGKYTLRVIGYNGAMSTTKAYELTATYPTSSANTPQWFYESITYDTPHNYPDNYSKVISYTKTGASKVRIHFSQFATEEGYDFVYIYDKNENLISQYSGSLSPFWATVDGEKMYIRFVSDTYVNDYGFTLDQAGYYHTTELIE